MTSVAITKTVTGRLTEQERQLLGGILFGMFRGCTEQDNADWQRMWAELMHAQEGEVIAFDFSFIRDGYYHRRHMLLESAVFEAQEQYLHFEQFRNWLKTGSGFVDWRATADGLKPEPKSISYDKCEQVEMEKFHKAAILFLRTPRAQQALWPALSPARAAEMLETLLARFNQ